MGREREREREREERERGERRERERGGGGGGGRSFGSASFQGSFHIMTAQTMKKKTGHFSLVFDCGPCVMGELTASFKINGHFAK